MNAEQRARQEALEAVRAAVERGELVRPPVCESCGQPHRRSRRMDTVDAYHASLAPEDRLRVAWLCGRCRGRAERGRKRRALRNAFGPGPDLCREWRRKQTPPVTLLGLARRLDLEHHQDVQRYEGRKVRLRIGVLFTLATVTGISARQLAAPSQIDDVERIAAWLRHAQKGTK